MSHSFAFLSFLDSSQYSISINQNTKVQIPMYYVENKVKVEGNIAEIKFIQYYFNNENDFVETEYIFPVHILCTFTGIEAKFEDQIIVSQISLKEQAKTMYEAAISSGDTALLAHPCRKGKDMIRIQIGNLPPRSQIIVTCTFHQVLEVEDLSWKLHIPSKIFPRYTGDSLGYVNHGAHLQGMIKQIIKEEEKAENHENLLELVRGNNQTVKFSWNITVQISSTTSIKRLVCPSHDIKVGFLDDSRIDAFVELKDPGDDTFFKKDFVILYRTDQINQPTILMQKFNNEYALMVSMLVDLTPEEAIKERSMMISDEIDLDPKIKYINLKSRIKPAEFYFILDRSGSMQGNKIVTAKETLKLFLHSLPKRSKFNVISFGTTFESIFDKWVDYNQK